jgi:hypothetical protein
MLPSVASFVASYRPGYGQELHPPPPADTFGGLLWEIFRGGTAPGGTLAVLIENLRLNGMLKFTTSICRSDWIECPHGRKYGFVFIDAVHNEDEARRHVPRLKEFLLPHAVVVVDDVSEQDFARKVCDLLGAREFTLTAGIDRSGKLMVSEIP